jgi:DNA recombination protein RmuC
MPESLLLLVAVGTGVVALLLGWLLWGRALGAARSRLSDQREALARSLAEVAAFKRQAEDMQPAVARAAELEALLSASEARLAERDCAHAAMLAERDRAQADALATRERVHGEQLAAMRGEFQRLAGEALERAQAQFSEQAAATLTVHRAEAAKGLADSRVALADLVAPIRDTLGRYGEELKAIEGKREQAYGSLAEQLQAVSHGQALVRTEAGKIVAALRSSSRASGAWGEAQLRNVLEMAGLREGIDFVLQASVTDEDGQRRRPDAVLKLPGGRELVIDSKCSLADYLAASEAASEGDRLSALRRHALSVRAHAKGLAEKAYWKQFATSADFVVLFVPGENFLSAALEQDLDLLGWALDQRILLAGPTNLLAIARVVAMVWRQEKMADEARAIGELGAELYAALTAMTEHVNRIGRNLGDASTAYNEFIGSLERNVLPKARRFPELGVERGKKPLPEAQPVEKTLRLVQAPDLKG